MESDISKYINCMERIKQRINFAKFLLDTLNNNTPLDLIAETVSLQIRKTLELIAFASIASHKQEYSKKFPNFFEHWRGKDIIDEIEKINPDFYPKPVKQIVNSITGKVQEIVPIKEEFLTKDEYIKAYDFVSDYLHERNVYNTELNHKDAIPKLKKYLSEIIALLSHHTIQLLSSDKQWWIIMQGEDGKIQLSEWEKVD